MADEHEQVYSLGAWLRRRRKALDLTHAVVAQCVGCEESTIRKLETDDRAPSVSAAAVA
ncbi:MAG TPA: helix-turn-helix transcriptional regulator [Herpetosiphonaceae bacterium]